MNTEWVNDEKDIPATKKVVKSSIRSSTVMLDSFSATLKICARISGGVLSPRNTASCLSRITLLAKSRINWQALATLLWNGNDDTEILQNGLRRLSWIPSRLLETDDGNGLLSSRIVSISTSNATCVYKNKKKKKKFYHTCSSSSIKPKCTNHGQGHSQKEIMTEVMPVNNKKNVFWNIERLKLRYMYIMDVIL